MIKLKKFVAFFLGILFTVNTLPISAFAATKYRCSFAVLLRAL